MEEGNQKKFVIKKVPNNKVGKILLKKFKLPQN
jgi:hypothetical protein